MDDLDRKAKWRGENRARERHLARQRRRQGAIDPGQGTLMRFASERLSFSKAKNATLFHRGLAWMFSSRQPVAKLTGVVVLAILIFFVGSYVFTDRIFPNVFALGVPVGDLTPAEAEAAIQAKWDGEIYIDFTVDGELVRQITPNQLGLSIDVAAMAGSARAAGLAGIPFGLEVAPVVSVDYGKAQSVLLDMTEVIYILPYDAGFKWSGGKLVTVPGRQGRHLDISEAMEKLLQDPSRALAERRFEVPTISLLPDVMDSAPFIEEAHAFLAGDVRLNGYDPYMHEMISWHVDQKTAAEWLIAGENGLAVRKNVFSAFIKSLNKDLVTGSTARFIDDLVAIEKMQDGLNTNNANVVVRVQHLPKSYYVENSDTGYKIGRKNGLPYQLVYESNPNVDWRALNVGDQIQIPSRDALIPEDPLPHKRIVIDIESQWLVAFEYDQMVFSWAISSGRETAPTYPGIFQILTHNDVAYGGSYALCEVAGNNCAQWRMNWFMGIYEVVPGLMNGFHGAVQLPNGNYLGGGGVYEPTTFGCIMSLDDNAELLYAWAENGTIVEILSDDFHPESRLGEFALNYISTIDTTYRPISA